MTDQSIIDKIRKENYVYKISEAFSHSHYIEPLSFKLIGFIHDVYRYLEPSHFKGKLIIYATLDDTIPLDIDLSDKLYDKGILINDGSDIIVLQYFNNESQCPLIWKNTQYTSLLNSNNVILYFYENMIECFHANQIKIEIFNSFLSASIYALQYHALQEALNRYKTEKISCSSCSIFDKSWSDAKTRIFFKNKPEEVMQISIKEFLSSALRGVDVVREYTLGASKPVDVRVYWKEANRAALIELKWLGQSKREDGELSQNYSNHRACEGLEQLKNYLDLAYKDTPTCISKGYLLVIDGRRKGTNIKSLSSINAYDGLFYKGTELDFSKANKYFDTIVGFERPIRMFAEPICV